jgi:MFS family permease
MVSGIFGIATRSPAPMSQVQIALIATLTIQVLVSLAGIAGPVLAPLAAPELGLEASLVGIYVSVIYGLAAVAALMSGGFIARYGAMRVSQVCLALAGAGMILVSLGTPLFVLAGAAVMGLAYGPATPASSHILARVTPQAWMNLVFSAKQTGVPLGNALAGALVPSLGLAFGWRGALLSVAAISFVAAAAAEPLRARFDVERATNLPFFARGQFVGPLALVFASSRLRQLSITSFAYSGMQVSLSAFLVTYLNQKLGLSVVAAGLMLSAAQAAGVAGRIAWGLLADRLVDPHRLLGALGFGMTAFAVFAGLFTPSWPQVVVLIVCVGFGATAVAWNGVFLAQIARLSPPGRVGEVTGGTSFLTFGGVMVMPAVFSGILASTGSYTIGFVFAAVLTFASALSYFVAGAPLTVRR